ncbi:hypothetical protein Tco_0494515 [Tanacetum coccineum]
MPFQPQYSNQEEQMLFHQFKMQMQMNKQQQSNQFATSQPHSEQQSHHLVDETEEEEEEPLPTPTSKPNRCRKKSVAKKKTKENMWKLRKKPKKDEFDMRGPKPRSFFWRKVSFKFSEDPKNQVLERTKNMLTGKWTPMNAAVMKFNQLYEKTLAHMRRTMRNLYDDGCSNCYEPSFGDDELPRPSGLQRIAKSQRSGSNSTASSGSNPVAYQEFMAEQYDLDRKAKMQVLSQESEDRRRLIQAQKVAEDIKVLQIDTSGMDPTYAAIINAQKERIRAEYLPPN